MSLQYLLVEELRFIVEIYRKNYVNHPISTNHSIEDLFNNRISQVMELEVLLQKKLSRRLYRQVVRYTYSIARFETPERGQFI